jgi:putative protease
MMASHREFHTGFYFGEKNKQVYSSSSYIRTHDIVGIVKDYDSENCIATIEQRNKVFDGDIVQILRPVGENFEIALEDMRDMDGNRIEATPQAQMIYTIKAKAALKRDDILIKGKEEK